MYIASAIHPSLVIGASQYRILSQVQSEIEYAASANGKGFESGEQMRMSGTSDTHANNDQLSGGWINVSISIILVAIIAEQRSKIFFILAFFNSPNPLKL